MNVLTQPYRRPRARPDNFSTTVETLYDLPAAVAAHAPGQVDLTDYLAAHPGGLAPIWALAENRTGPSVWGKVAVGDLVLFYGDSHVYAYAYVGSKVHWSGNNFVWPNGTGWDWIYSLTGMTLLSPTNRIRTDDLKAHALPRFGPMQAALHDLNGGALPQLLQTLTTGHPATSGAQASPASQRPSVQGATDPGVDGVALRTRIGDYVAAPTQAQTSDELLLRAVLAHLGPLEENPHAEEPDLKALLSRALESLEETFSPGDDLDAPATGRVSERGLTKLLRALTGTPRCFILSQADHPVSAHYEDVEGATYGFDDTVSARKPFLGAGPGSRVIFYRTQKASSAPRRAFVAHAAIGSLDRPEPGKYRATLEDYHALPSPVPYAVTNINGWNRQHGIVEITFATFTALLAAAGVALDEATSGSARDSEADRAAAGRLKAAPEATALLDLHGKADALPALPGGSLDPSPEITAPYNANWDDPITRPLGRRSKNQSRLDKRAEARAVYLATQHLRALGWTMTRDQQAAGVGYDLLFTKDGEDLHLEVKGIQGSKLVFNLTAKEWSRALEDPLFLVAAVTDVLDDQRVHVHLITRSELVTARRAPVSYRLQVAQA